MDKPKNIEDCLKDRLELPKAVMIQLRETCLFNPMIDKAIEDIDYLLEKAQQNEA